MKHETKMKHFRDPIHGYIEVAETELDIVNHPLFQRLRRIKQLGLAHYVFHGAEHTRFGHSLGTMSVANDILDAVPEIDCDLRRKISLAALLHDIGHLPLSHTFEKCIRDVMGVEGHEEYTKAIMLDPGIPEAYYNRGLAYYYKGKYAVSYTHLTLPTTERV